MSMKDGFFYLLSGNVKKTFAFIWKYTTFNKISGRSKNNYIKILISFKNVLIDFEKVKTKEISKSKINENAI